MHRNEMRAGGWWLRTLAVVVIGLAVIGPAVSNRASAHQGRDADPLDLAAMSLRPEDLAEVGLEGYGVDQGELLTAEQQVAEFVSVAGGDPDEFTEILIDEAGLEAGYTNRIALAVEPGDVDSVATSVVLVTLYAFEDEEGAETGFDFMSAEPTPDEAQEIGYQALETDVVIGDATDLYGFETEDEEFGDHIQALDVSFRTDRVMADVGYFDVLREGEKADDPEVDDVLALAELLLDRIEAGLDGDTPGLGGAVVRMQDDEAGFDTRLDIYTVVDGETFWRFTDDEADVEARADRMSDAGIVDGYAVEQEAVLGSEESLADPYYSARVYRFEDEDAAAAYVEEGAFTSVENDSNVTDFERVRRVDRLGDSIAAASYEAEIGGQSFSGRIVAVQSGDLVAVIRMESGNGVNLDTVLEVVEMQLDCLDAGSCDGPVAPPKAFVD